MGLTNLIIAAIVVFGGLWLIRQFAKSSPQQSAALIRKAAGWGCIAGAGFMTLRGGFAVAVPLFLFGAGLIGINPQSFAWARRTPGQKSRVQTSLLAMELDHDTGKMDGEVLEGPFKGRRLTALKEEELKAFHGQCARAGDQSLALLQAWLDRAKPEWRETWQGAGRASPPASGKMSKEEAYAVLGLKTGASTEDIRAAHRRLMKEFHPDKGGSDYLASKINEAKDVLLQD